MLFVWKLKKLSFQRLSKIMTMRILGVLLVFALLCNNVLVVISRDCLAPTAAFTLRGYTYLIDGNDYVKLDKDLKETKAGSMMETFGIGGNIDAAFMLGNLHGPSRYLNFAKGLIFSVYDLFYGSSMPQSLPFTVNNVRIDAMSQLEGYQYYFIGCDYIINKGSPTKLKYIGLPICNVDAAFNHDGKMYIIKGENCWLYSTGDRMRGPYRLRKLVRLTSNNLCGKILSYDEKADDEKKQETENNCVVIDAAFMRDDTVYLFNEDEYIALPSFVEQEKKPISDFGLPKGTVDAALALPPMFGLSITNMFQRRRYYEYFPGKTRFRSHGIIRVSPFSNEAIDAAAELHDVSYFFKDCLVSGQRGDPMDLQSLALPCNVDAAYSNNGFIYVIKGDQVWSWGGFGSRATGPEPLTKVMKITSWTVCPY